MKKIVTLLVTLLSLQITLFAASKSESVTFYEPITVASSTLPAGTYTVTYSEDGSKSNVTFSKGKKDIAVVPATIVVKKNPEFKMLANRTESGKKLQGLEFKSATLSFTGANPAAASGN